jgi:hypothetical protein
MDRQRFLVALILQRVRLHPLDKLVVVATARQHKRYNCDKNFFIRLPSTFPVTEGTPPSA